MGGSERWHINSSLPTPMSEISSGIRILLIEQRCDTLNAKRSSHANNPTGLGSESNQSSSFMWLVPQPSPFKFSVLQGQQLRFAASASRRHPAPRSRDHIAPLLP